ncbi:MAG: long-chain fatty acid--CoA ligase, partial [Myxococcota bacterium]|nr:long-chain fatty acid--CoA ligase [Myxococcota bacterium]
MQELEAIEAELTAPGGPFEVTVEEVRGRPMAVFAERPRSLRALVEASRERGDAEYLVCEDVRLSFAEHARRVASVAAALRERFGVGPGDRVAILAENRPEWIVTWWATVSLGAVAVALNGWWAGPEIAFGVEDAEPRVLIGDRKRLARVAPGALGAVPVVEMESEFADLASFAPEAPLPEAPIDEDDPAVILYTSGTTGRPKGAVSSHRAVLCFVRLGAFHGARLMLWSLRHGGAQAPPPLPPCMLVTAPLFHVSGLYAGALTGLANGLKTVWTRGRFDPGRVLRLIEEERVTSWGPMGTMAHRVAHHPDVGRFDLSSMRNVGSGGAPMGPALQARLREIFPHARGAMGLGYGLTESTTSLTIIGGPELEAHPESVGRPLPTVELSIRD